MAEDSKIDIILATHNNLGTTIRCIETLYAHTPPDVFRLNIFDDSVDLTPDWLEWYKKQNSPYEINITHSVEPYREGNHIINEGIKNTTSPIIVYMGNSTFVEPDWFNNALKFLGEVPDVGLLGFKLLKPTGIIEHAGIWFTPDMAHHINRGLGEPSHRYSFADDIGLVGWAMVMFKRQAIARKGLLEGIYNPFCGCDDLDNCMVMRENGWKVCYFGLTVAYHYALSTRGEFTPENDKKHWENIETFKKRWFKDVKSPTNSIR